jgi:hypothetical protein
VLDRSADDIIHRVADGVPGNTPVPRTARTPQPLPITTTDGTLRRTLLDAFESARRVARQTRLPDRKGLAAFFGKQLGVNAVAWTAGLLAVEVVSRFFEVKGIRNLWGLAAWGGRTPISAEDYHLITSLTSYTAGLLMLILMRHLVLRWIAELHALRAERKAGSPTP